MTCRSLKYLRGEIESKTDTLPVNNYGNNNLYNKLLLAFIKSEGDKKYNKRCKK